MQMRKPRPPSNSNPLISKQGSCDQTVGLKLIGRVLTFNFGDLFWLGFLESYRFYADEATFGNPKRSGRRMRRVFDRCNRIQLRSQNSPIPTSNNCHAFQVEFCHTTSSLRTIPHAVESHVMHAAGDRDDRLHFKHLNRRPLASTDS